MSHEDPSAKPMVVTHDRGRLCRAILGQLPEWFGRPAALEAYVAAAETLPMLACFGDDGAPVGFLSFQTETSSAVGIHVMGVVPNLHRCGIGRTLVQAAARNANRGGAKLLTVKTLAPTHPDPHYAATRTFYEALGFLPVEILPTLWGKDIPCLLMAMPLPTFLNDGLTVIDIATIEDGERRLLDAETRASADAVAELLADDFVEVGQSGRAYDRRAILQALDGEHQAGNAPERELIGLHVRPLGGGIALATYRAERRTPGAPDVVSVRSSVWRRDGDRWRMAFHQGTSVAVAASPNLDVKTGCQSNP